MANNVVDEKGHTSARVPVRRSALSQYTTDYSRERLFKGYIDMGPQNRRFFTRSLALASSESGLCSPVRSLRTQPLSDPTGQAHVTGSHLLMNPV